MSSDSKDLLTDLRRVGFLKAADTIEALEGENAVLKHDIARHMEIANAAEARAERLRVFVAHVAKQQTVEEMGDEATFADFEGGWTSIVLDARKALEDDKQ